MRHFLWISICTIPLLCWSQESYVVNSINYSYKTLTSPTAISKNAISDVSIPIGFDFTFYDQKYDEVYSNINGYITFLELQGDSDFGGLSIPGNDIPNGFIAGNWSFLAPSQGSSITYQTMGEAPERVFIIAHENFSLSGNNLANSRFQIQLFEGLNTIEIHCENCTNSGSPQTQGIENQFGTEGITYPGRNRNVYNLWNEGVIFVPIRALPGLNEITLSWQNIFNKAGYTLQRSVDGNNYTTIATLSPSQTSFNDTALDSDTEYYYRLMIPRTEGTRQIDIVSGTTPNIPTGLSAAVNGAIEIELRWVDDSNTEDGYVIERSLPDEDGFEIIASIPANSESYVDKSLNSETTYDYRISTFNARGTSPVSKLASATTRARSLYFVDKDATGRNNGKSWTDAFTDLSAALKVIGDGADIWIADGTYKPGGIAPIETSSFEINVAGLRIYGGFNGTEEKLEDRKVEIYTTILSGDIGIIDDRSDNIDQIIYYSNSSNFLQVFDLTIEDADSDTAKGGGLQSVGKVRLENVTFKNNSASNGGALYAFEDTYLSGCIFKNNSAVGSSHGYGGAIYYNGTEHSKVWINNSEFTNNEAMLFGGAIATANRRSGLSTISMNDVYVSENEASYGGGIFFQDVNAFVSNTIISDNMASASDGFGGGGGLFIYHSTVTIDSATISGNHTAATGGGLYVERSSELKMNRVIIVNNLASTDGAGLCLEYVNDLSNDQVQIVNTVIADNEGMGACHEDM
ncbi:hypothetical protein FNH22_28665 [Fulvivirga sp. M361]|uniref:fibronectin type III domain-containing protein n=1 Tax=Fulvivirga sp. M361 TaxID=2594266 RepID=UPI00117B37D1|nr:fibronectin type III domain-containing protein [Fulvivirga sp. M361]TRX48570.1 hypothetical protein FNH22_28665 [Fulvivirga sp. M361]